MPLADKPIIAPGQVNSRSPLKKSTVAWMVGVPLVLAVVGIVGPQLGGSSSESAAKPAKASVNGSVGDPRTIDNEFSDAKQRTAAQAVVAAQKTKEEQDAAAKKAAEQPPVPASVGLAGRAVPADARRTSNSAALYSKADVPGTADPSSVEFDASARVSTSVKHDFGESSNPAKEAAGDVATRLRALLPQAPEAVGRSNSGVDVAGSAVNALIDAQRKAAGVQTSGTTSNQTWVKELATDTGRAKPIKSYPTVSPFTLLQGKVIPAVLGRDLNSDLPGEVTACTTVDIYDSITSNYLLIPKGSCLMGRYQSSVAPGQERLMFAFTRIILPSGLSMDLPGNTGTDLSGAAGIAGDVNNHFFKMFANSFLVAWMADRAEASKPAPSTTYGSTSGATTAAGQVLVDVSRSILDRQKTIPPTITVEKGARINVEVTRDMEFPGPYKKG